MKKSLLLFALLALVLPLSAFAQSPAPAPTLAMLQPAAAPQIDWAAIAGTSPQTLPNAAPIAPQFLTLGWCSVSCTPCPCTRAQGLCQPYACIGGN